MIPSWLRLAHFKITLRRFQVPRDAVRWAFDRYADRTALITPTSAFTYGALASRVFSLANGWSALGVRKGDHVFTHLHDDHEQIEVRLAAYELGVILTSFNEAHALELITRAVRMAPPTMFIIGPRTDDGVRAMLVRECPSMPILRAGTGDTYERVISQHHARQATSKIAPTDPAALGFTSGTTGVPKALYVDQQVALTSLRLTLANVRIVPTIERQVTLVCIPLIGAGSGLVLPSIIAGGAMVIPPSYDLEHALPLVEEHNVTRIFMTPSQLIDVLDWPVEQLPDMSTVTNVIYGTAPTPAAKIEEALRRFGPIFQQGYGMAEVLPPVSLLQMEDHLRDGIPAPLNVLSSVGRVVPQVQVIIANEKDAPLPTGEIGQVLIKSPTVFSGYWRQPELTARTLAGGWMHTGDFGFFDREGFLHVLDRRPDLLRRGDKLIYPRTIEEVAHEHPSVKEACLVSHGPELVMCVSLRRAARGEQGDPIAEESAGAELMSFLSERLEPWQLPDRVRVLEELPRSYLRKVLRREIREMLAREGHAHEGQAISTLS